MEETKKPDWKKWLNVPWLNAVEAAALTMDCCPRALQSALDELPPPPYNDLDMFVLATSRVLEMSEAPELEKRLVALQRLATEKISPKDLASLARRNGWTVPLELQAPDEPKDQIRGQETLLKHVGLLALAIVQSNPRKYMINGRPNVAEIVRTVESVIDPGSRSKGIGASTLNESIKKGLDLLNKV